MSRSARILALGALLVSAGVAQAADWNLYLIDPIPLPASLDAFRQTMLETYGTEVPTIQAREDILNLFTLPGNFIKKPGVRYSSVADFEINGTRVYLYQNRNDVMSSDVTAIGMDDKSLEWLWQQFSDPDGDGIAEGWIQPGGQAMIDAFQRSLEATDEKPEVRQFAIEKFRQLIATSTLHDLDGDHPWVERAPEILGTGLDTSWSITVSDKGRGERLAERAMSKLEKALFGR